jgi:cell wall-associated NlpC family hydrolase
MTTDQRERLALVMQAYEGLLYVWGGNRLQDGGCDCSGSVQLAMARAGVEPWASRYPARLDLTATGLWDRLRELEPGGPPQVGDLAFYAAEDAPGHVVMVTGTDGRRETAVTGSTRGDSSCRTVEQARAARAWVVTRRGRDAHLYRADLVGLRQPELR